MKEKVLQDYIKYKRLTIKSDKVKDIEYLTRMLINSSKKKLEDFEETDLLDFFSKIQPNYSVQSFNNIKIYCKSFIKWHYVDWSSRFRNLDKICRTEKAKQSYPADVMITEKQFGELIKAEQSHFWKGFFSILFYGGCRASEVCRLKWKDFENDEEGGAFFSIFSNKNKDTFLKYVPAEVMFYVNKQKQNGSEWVFFNPRTKKPITKKGAYFEIRKLSEKVLGRKIDLLTLRHSIATIHYNKEDVKDDIVARQMGHGKSMKDTYVRNHKEKLKEQAKSIFIKGEDLPPEKKEEYEKRIEKLEKYIEEIRSYAPTIKFMKDRLDKDLEGLRAK